MATTQNTFNGTGSNLGPFSFTFKWLESTDIKVTVGGVLKTAGTHYNLQGLNYTTKTGGQVLFTAGNAPPTGTNNIRIYRDTDDAELSATFSSGSAIRAKDLNDNFTQNLYVTQEVNNNSVNIDGSNTMVGNLDMGGYRVINNGVPTNDNDAVTKKYVDDRTGNVTIPGHTYWRYVAVGGETTLTGPGTGTGTLQYSATREQVFLNGALQQRTVDYTANNGTSITFNVALTAGDVVDVRCVNNLASGNTGLADDIVYGNQFTGQVSRSVATKLSDIVSVKDFGAVGDGVTDDTAAIQAALNSFGTNQAGSVYIPQGRYVITGTGLTVPPGVTFYGVTKPGEILPNGSKAGNDWGLPQTGGRFDYRLMGSVLVMERSTTRAITVKNRASLEGISIIPPSMLFAPSTEAAIVAELALYNDVSDDIAAIRAQAADSFIKNCFIMGYVTAVDGEGSERLTCDTVKFDCKNGIIIKDSLDSPRLISCHGFPYWSTGHNAAVVSNLTRRKGIAYHINNVDGAKALNIFAYGHDVGLKVESSFSFTGVNINFDNAIVNAPTSLAKGVWVVGSCQSCKLLNVHVDSHYDNFVFENTGLGTNVLGGVLSSGNAENNQYTFKADSSGQIGCLHAGGSQTNVAVFESGISDWTIGSIFLGNISGGSDIVIPTASKDAGKVTIGSIAADGNMAPSATSIISAPAFEWNRDGTPAMGLNSSGNLSLGTKLGYADHKTPGGTNQNARLSTAGNDYASSAALLTNWGASTYPYLALARSQSGTIGTHSAISGGDVPLGSIVFEGSDGTDFGRGANIISKSISAWTDTSHPTKLIFGTTSSGSVAPTDRLTLNDVGGVVIADKTGSIATPSGGGVLYVEAGALKYRGSSGTTTVIAPA